MDEEKVYNVPLRGAKKAERRNRASKAVRIVKDFLKRHTKATEIIIDNSLNQEIWEKGAENPPNSVRVRAVKLDEDLVEAYTIEE